MNEILKKKLQGISKASIRLEEADQETVVFYKLAGNDKSVELLKKRLIKSSAGLIILNREISFKHDKKILVVNDCDFMETQKVICDAFYPFKKSIKLIGITGTNGKTSTVFLGVQIAHMQGVKALSIGTLGVRDHLGEVYQAPEGTTPSYLDLRKMIFWAEQNFFKAIFLEVSSHGLKQQRIYKMLFAAVGWTNFTQDHLDYHGDMDDYFSAKSLLPRKHLEREGSLVVPKENVSLKVRLKENKTPFVETKGLDFYDQSLNDDSIFSKGFNRSNLEVALSLFENTFDLKIESLKTSKISTAKGRFSIMPLNKGVVVIDYAHTPDALLNICEEVKKIYGDYDLTLIFGCGGDRDRSKRSIMGKIASKHANKIILTSDNPRTEDPTQIIEDISGGVVVEHEKIENRKLAIDLGLKEIKSDEVIVIAGKGHEEYQDVGGEKIFFSDFETVRNFVKENEGVSFEN